MYCAAYCEESGFAVRLCGGLYRGCVLRFYG